LDLAAFGEGETNALAVSIALKLIFDLDLEQGEFGAENMDRKMSQKFTFDR
jgi:hypothetical protein